jgi:hypothetical protein
VATMVVLLDQTNGEFCLRQQLVEKLGRLGVTSVAVVRDERTVGIIFEGWLLDPFRSAGAAAAAVGAPSDAPVLHPVLQMAVSTAADEGGSRVKKTSQHAHESRPGGGRRHGSECDGRASSDG